LGSLKTTLKQISNPEFQNKFLSSVLKNGHFDLLSELLGQKDFLGMEKLLKVWSAWARENDSSRFK